MSESQNPQMDTIIEVTDFFGGDRKKHEVLAQPETCCGCITCGEPAPASDSHDLTDTKGGS
jgi:hypothetical protein